MDQDQKNQLLADLQSDVEDIRKDACRILTQEGDQSVLNVLRDISSKDTVAVRYFARKAVDAIVKRCGRPVERAYIELEDLLEHDEESGRSMVNREKILSYLADPDQSVRLAVIDKATEIAAKASNEQILPILTHRLADAEDPVEKSFLVKTIGILGSKEHVSVLIPFLKDHDSRVRADTIEALEYIGDTSVYPAIIPLLQDGDNRVQANAAVAFRMFGGDKALDLLEKMLGSSLVWLRDSAAFALREIKLPQAVKLLLNFLKKETKYNVYLKAVESLSRIGSRSDIPIIKTFIQLEDDKRKKDMLTALLKSLQGQIVDFSILKIHAGLEAVEALLQSDEDTRAALEEIAADLEPSSTAQVREEAEEAAGTGVPALVAGLIDDLSNPDEEVRKQAVIKLVSIGDAAAVPALKKAAADPDNVVRYYAKKALRELKSSGIHVEPLKSPSGKIVRLVTVPFKYGLAGAAALVVLLCIAWTIYSWTVPEEKVLQTKKKITSSFERLVKVYDRYTGVGKTVTWSGIVRDVNREDRILVLQSHSYLFSAHLPHDDPCNYVRGDVVKATGVVKSRSMFGAVKLLANSVEMVKSNKQARELAERSGTSEPDRPAGGGKQ